MRLGSDTDPALITMALAHPDIMITTARREFLTESAVVDDTATEVVGPPEEPVAIPGTSL